jgi:hypothetical protein
MTARKILLLVLIFSIASLSGCTSKYESKYEGLTAEEWAYEYDYIFGCAEQAYYDLERVESQEELGIVRSNLYNCL